MARIRKADIRRFARLVERVAEVIPRSTMLRAVIVVVALLGSAAAQPLAAQQAVADSLWRIGRRDEALSEYRRILASDSNSVRANFRVAYDVASRDVDSALVLIRNARAREPNDLDLRLAEATYLSWSGKFAASVVRYDSIVAAHPELDHVRIARARTLSWNNELLQAARGYQQVLDRNGTDAEALRDAAFGLAQVSAWLGDLTAASEQYSNLLASNPAELRSLLGLAAVRTWQGRPHAARELLQRVIAADSSNADVPQLLKAVARSISPSLELQASWGRDSDGNDVAWQLATQSFLIRDGMRLWGSFGSQRAKDPLRLTSRLLGEVGGSAARGLAQFTALVGARQMDVTTAPTGAGRHTEVTWRGSASLRPHSNLTLGLGASHVPFDEVAALLEKGINITSYDGSVEWRPRQGHSLAASGGVLDFSDGNQRRSALVRLSRRFSPALTVAAMLRTFSFERNGEGYFTPERFVLADLNGSWEREIGRWSLALSGGGGIQSLGPDLPQQGQWHVDARAGVRLSEHASVSVLGGTSTSAAASAVGAYRFQTAGVVARIMF